MESKGKRLEKRHRDPTQLFVCWITAQAFYAIYFFSSDIGVDANFLELCASAFVGMSVTTVLSFTVFFLYKASRT